MLTASLAYVGLAVNQPAEIAEKLHQDFGLSRMMATLGASGQSVPVLGIGGAALVLMPAGNRAAGDVLRPGVHHLTLQSATLDDATAAVAAAGIEIAPPQLALHGRSAVELSAGRLGGVRLFLSEPPDLPKVTPGPVERIDHIGVASADNGAALAMYCDQLGFALESRQIDREIATVIETFSSDRYGVVRHSRPAVVAGGLRVAFVTIGDCELEFLENFNPDQDGAIDHGARGTTRQDQGAISRYIASRGAGLHHLAFKVADIDGLLASLAAKGYDVIDPVGRPGSRRARIGFIHPRSMGGLLLHLVERSELSGPAEPE